MHLELLWTTSERKSEYCISYFHALSILSFALTVFYFLIRRIPTQRLGLTHIFDFHNFLIIFSFDQSFFQIVFQQLGTWILNGKQKAKYFICRFFSGRFRADKCRYVKKMNDAVTDEILVRLKPLRCAYQSIVLQCQHNKWDPWQQFAITRIYMYLVEFYIDSIWQCKFWDK